MDRIIRCITTDGSIMASAVETTDIVYTAQQIHHTSPVTTAALGRLLSAASLMGNMLKKKDAVITLKIKGNGPAGAIVAIADSNGNCRGYVEHPEVMVPNKPNGKLDVGMAIGSEGLLSVMRDLGEGEPYIGQVELISGEIGDDISQYFAVSEQIPTVCAVGVLVDRESSQSLLSGGMLIQVLPGADSAAIEKLERNVAVLEPVTTMLAKGMSMEDMCRQALDGFEMEILDESPVKYVCNCSEDKVTRALSTLPPDDIRTLADESGKMEAKCQYCGKSYEFDQQQLDSLAHSLERKNEEK
ncbi:MAG: Hsp33 family molecular chaperone HslO [Clostridium sp.]|uniref:Hsp33 family molecular chaperone HslO n=1 Tax=Clostridium sp. TaxID=1506 RepID=UPI00290DFE13|nr:Hsp33 family molecular chaperone HslO [Clostridium sp.]MDU7337213.1 Hsp33 family molecular chaperone HslO [Clostridium sp.]